MDRRRRRQRNTRKTGWFVCVAFPAAKVSVVVNLDIDTPSETLRAIDYRICGLHFDKDDFVFPRRAADRKNPQRKHLKKNAIPRVLPLPADRLEASGILSFEPPGGFHSTPKKSTEERQSASSLPSALTLILTSPEPAVVRPRTKPTQSGSYLARHPTYNLSEVMGATSSSQTLCHAASEDIPLEDVDDPLHDMSGGFVELGLDDPADESFKPLSDTTPSNSGTGSTSSKGSENSLEDRKWLVDELKIMELFETCHQCGMALEDKTMTKNGSQIRINWTCLEGHCGRWQSCPDQRKMARNNILTCAATLFTGATFTDIKDWAQLLNLQLPSKAQFYAIQGKYLIPAINQEYQAQQDHHMEHAKQECAAGKRIELGGDARCDSPGFSAKFSTYSFQEDATKKILHFELVQVTEATSSVAMEALGFERGLNHLIAMNVDVGVITTDRAPSIRKIMRENYGHIRHEFDAWHVSKSIKKKILSQGNKKENRDLLPWLKSITNHLYWSCMSSHGDGKECVRRWTSLQHHICGVHRWEEAGVEYTCHHAPLTEDEQRKKRWIKADSPAFRTLKGIILANNLIRDLEQMALFKHTGSLEVYHSSMLKYTQKRLHFSYNAMLARTQLAVMDHNANVGRPQAITAAEGRPRYSLAYSKPSSRWVARPIYEPTTQHFRQSLIERALKLRDEHNLGTRPWPRPPPRHKRLLVNIAPVPRPEKSELIAKTTSRFKKL